MLGLHPLVLLLPMRLSLMPLSTAAAFFLSTGRAKAKKTNKHLLYAICDYNKLHLKCGKETLHLYLIFSKDRWYPWTWYWGKSQSVLLLTIYIIDPQNLRLEGQKFQLKCSTDGSEWVLMQWDNPSIKTCDMLKEKIY